ncbi:MAG: RNA polymerase subunit sigma-24 [Phycisphaerae bacterium]|nr:RNA polymerase subunit sigma-24 [Phycisphaerae bacterium]
MAKANDDRSLLERIADGDAGAVHEVVDTYGGMIWSLASRFTSTEADAEEAVQEVFLLLWRKAARYDRSKGAEATFISILTRRLLIDRWRRAAKRPRPVPAADRAIEHAAFAQAELDELADAAVDAFGELDAARQEALRLSVEMGLTHAEIAELTDTPLGTVKSRIRSGLRAIRERVENVDKHGGARPEATVREERS